MDEVDPRTLNEIMRHLNERFQRDHVYEETLRFSLEILQKNQPTDPPILEAWSKLVELISSVLPS